MCSARVASKQLQRDHGTIRFPAWVSRCQQAVANAQSHNREDDRNICRRKAHLGFCSFSTSFRMPAISTCAACIACAKSACDKIR